MGVPLSGPHQNVEIYFSKIDMKNFASDTIILLQNRFILTKWGYLHKSRVQTVKIWLYCHEKIFSCNEQLNKSPTNMRTEMSWAYTITPLAPDPHPRSLCLDPPTKTGQRQQWDLVQTCNLHTIQCHTALFIAATEDMKTCFLR